MNIPKYAKWVMNFFLGYFYLAFTLMLASVMMVFSSQGGIIAQFAGLTALVLWIVAFVATIVKRDKFYITKKK